MVRKCLIVDDNSMKDDSEAYVLEAKRKGIQLNFLEEFGIGRQERNDLIDDRNNLDAKKIIKAFEREYENQIINLFAVDFDFEDEAERFTGLEAIRIIRARFSKAIIILYSANLDKVAQKIIDDIDPEDLNSALERIKTLFSAKITRIVKREDLGNSIISELGNKPPSYEEMLLNSLGDLPDISFRSEVISIQNRAKIFGDISPTNLIKEIQSGSNLGSEIVKELMDRMLAYWIDYNID